MPVKLTTKNFIEKAVIQNGLIRYDYSKVEYINSNHKVRILCKIHGEFLSRPTDHLRGHGCPMCGNNTTKNKEQFIEKAVSVHSLKYKYDLVEYISNKKKVDIICPSHGVFSQVPNSHLSGRGCPNCSKNSRLTHDDFILKSKEIHGDLFNYSKASFKLAKESVAIICNKHGEFNQIAANHMVGAGCPHCATENISKNNSHTTEEFIAKAVKRHGNKYDYSLVKYSTSKQLVSIICPIHGVFEQSAGSHLSGQGCIECGRDSSGWSRTKFNKLVKKKGSGTLYVIRLFNKEESFIKIGLTTRTIKHRAVDFPYNYKIIYKLDHKDGILLFNLEKHIHKLFKEFRYKPINRFGGETECFVNIDLQRVLSEIKKFCEEYTGG